MDRGVQGNILAAIHDYKLALTIDTSLEINTDVWDLLCWVGVLHNQAIEILFASEKATHSRPDFPVYRDTRGLVRALTGDIQGAIDDFESVIEKIGDHQAFGSAYRFVGFGDVERRKKWLKALRLGQNPFTPELLETMRKQEGIGCDGEGEEAEVVNGVISEDIFYSVFPGMTGLLPGIGWRVRFRHMVQTD
jgi:hypothetical protein